MEFQFGTNWARFSRYAGGVIGQTLAMEGLFAFFLESSFLGLLVFGERRLGPRGHFLAALALFAGSWLSGYFIIATNAFMQHPVGHVVAADGTLQLDDFWAFLLNPWALAQYAHNMVASVVTASFVVAAVGAYYALERLHVDYAAAVSPARRRRGPGVERAGRVPDRRPAGEARRPSPAGGAGGDGGPLRERDRGRHRDDRPAQRAGAAARQPDRRSRASSASSRTGPSTSNVKGLNEFPEDQWPDNIELLYYAFHVMVGLGTLFILVMGIAALLLLRGTLTRSRAMLWMLMLAFPFPYIATTAGWMTAELGRQPWLVYGLMRTAEGASPTVHSGTALFTLIGFTGLYFVLGVLFLFLVGREIAHGRSRSSPARRPARMARSRRPVAELWFAIAAVMLTAYVVLDGFDFGAGALHLFVARSDPERRQVLGAIGPFWDGNEVWLLATGGALFVAFPRVLASGLSGFYFAIFLVLWALILRGHLDRVPQPRRPPAVARGVGRGLRRRQRAPAGPVRRSAREPRARAAARRGRLVLAPALHGLHRAAARRDPRLVHAWSPACSRWSSSPATARRSSSGRPTGR